MLVLDLFPFYVALSEENGHQTTFALVNGQNCNKICLNHTSHTNVIDINLKFPKHVYDNITAEIFVNYEQEEIFIGFITFNFNLFDLIHLNNIHVEFGEFTNVSFSTLYDTEENVVVEYNRKILSIHKIYSRASFKGTAKRKKFKRQGKTLDMDRKLSNDTNVTKAVYSTKTVSSEGKHIPGTPRKVDYTSIWIGFGAWLVIVITAVVVVGYKVHSQC